MLNEQNGRAEQRSPTRPPSVLVGAFLVLVCAIGLACSNESEASDAPTGSSDTTASTTAEATTTSSTSPPTEPPSTTAPTTTAPTTMAPTTIPAGYAFPIVPASSASYARTHHTYPAVDIFAPCDLDVVAPHAGTVQELTTEDLWSEDTNTAESRGGLSFSIVGDDGVRYYGSHLEELDPAIAVGVRITTGQRIGSVGETGNAKGTGCHLHFGISTPCGPGDTLRRRGEFWPQEYLDAWARDEHLSPAPLADPDSC